MKECTFKPRIKQFKISNKEKTNQLKIHDRLYANFKDQTTNLEERKNFYKEQENN